MSSVVVDWEKYAEQYDTITMSGPNPAYETLVSKVVSYFEQLPVLPRSLVVDLGGGTGNFSLPLAKIFPDSKFVIVDTSQTMLDIARSKAEEQGSSNIDVMLSDVEDLRSITQKYGRKITHTIMLHCLYTTGGRTSKKPAAILKNVCESLEGPDSRFFISDINRPLRTNTWIVYCLWHAIRSFRRKGEGLFSALRKTVELFQENDQAKLANKLVDIEHADGSFLTCSLDELVDMIRKTGFSKIYETSDRYYRGRDNLVIAGL